VISASAIWLVPGLQHAVFARYEKFLASLFRTFGAIDYRDVYLNRGQQGLNDHIERTIERINPDLVIYTQFPNSYGYLRPAFIEQLRVRAHMVGLGFDDEIYFEQAKHFYAHCDAVITTDFDDLPRLQALGVSVYLAQLQQPQTFSAVQPVDEDIAVSFVGDMTKPGRREWVQCLESAGITVRDFGHGSRNGSISSDAVIDVFMRSKINLNFTRTNPPRWVVRHHADRGVRHQMKARPFELAALHKFCLCEWAPSLAYWFRPDEEIAVFRDPDGLAAAARRYLDDDQARSRIVEAAHERYRRDYAPEVQFSRIFGQILAQPRSSAARGLFASEPFFYESVGRSRGVAFLHALRAGRPLRALGETVADESSHLNYWRGFLGGLTDTMQTRLRGI
jgi:hypothetical protein